MLHETKSLRLDFDGEVFATLEDAEGEYCGTAFLGHVGEDRALRRAEAMGLGGEFEELCCAWEDARRDRYSPRAEALADFRRGLGSLGGLVR